jgi:hypothetical protein
MALRMILIVSLLRACAASSMCDGMEGPQCQPQEDTTSLMQVHRDEAKHGSHKAQAHAVQEEVDNVTLCNITANNHVEAFRTANATMMSDTYWSDAYMQYGTGPPVSSKVALGSFFGGFFDTMFNADLSGNLELDALITACPPNQKCFTFFSFRVSSCKVIWELNQLTAVYKVDDGKCLIEFETGINFPCADCVLSKCPS